MEVFFFWCVFVVIWYNKLHGGRKVINCDIGECHDYFKALKLDFNLIPFQFRSIGLLSVIMKSSIIKSTFVYPIWIAKLIKQPAGCQCYV